MVVGMSMTSLFLRINLIALLILLLLLLLNLLLMNLLLLLVSIGTSLLLNVHIIF